MCVCVRVCMCAVCQLGPGRSLGGPTHKHTAYPLLQALCLCFGTCWSPGAEPSGTKARSRASFRPALLPSQPRASDREASRPGCVWSQRRTSAERCRLNTRASAGDSPTHRISLCLFVSGGLEYNQAVKCSPDALLSAAPLSGVHAFFFGGKSHSASRQINEWCFYPFIAGL